MQKTRLTYKHSEDHININSITSDLKPNTINFIYLGIQKYMPMWKLQQDLHALRKKNKIPDVVLFLEHENVYTFGKNANTDFLLDSHLDADVINTDRGGQVTYHGPGQIVGYPIFNLHDYKKSITWFMSSLEQVIINTLKLYTIDSHRKDSLPGVWVEDEKICAMGVRIAQWVTMHGFALNIKPDMKYFDGMIPCGILDCGVTSMYDQLNHNVQPKDVIEVLSKEFIKVFNVK
tara:strand:+ start:1124 stop:1822 length:699 start_codon:yes stop_codon:yes gene_type:complete